MLEFYSFKNFKCFPISQIIRKELDVRIRGKLMWFICKVEKLLKIEKILVSSVGIPFIVH